ncbi:MAG: hypothetical protein ACOYB3_01845 [Azonexus sp.]
MSDVRLFIGMRDDKMVTRVTASPEGTEPSAWVELVVDVNQPNAYSEFMAVSGIFEAEFMRFSNDAMDGLIAGLIERNPGVADLVRDEVFDSARMSGFSEEDSAALRDSL